VLQHRRPSPIGSTKSNTQIVHIQAAQEKSLDNGYEKPMYPAIFAGHKVPEFSS
jgi:hypothetical protein